MSNFYLRRSPVTGESYDPMKQPRYSEVATFMRTPMASSLDELDIALVGVPYDGVSPIVRGRGTDHRRSAPCPCCSGPPTM